MHVWRRADRRWRRQEGASHQEAIHVRAGAVGSSGGSLTDSDGASQRMPSDVELAAAQCLLLEASAQVSKHSLGAQVETLPAGQPMSLGSLTGHRAEQRTWCSCSLPLSSLIARAFKSSTASLTLCVPRQTTVMVLL